MAEDLKGVFASGLDVVAEELRQDVIEETKDLVEDLNQVLNGFRGDQNSAEEVIAAVSKVALTLRSQAGTVGLRLIGPIAHRLEDYMTSLNPRAGALPDHALDDLQVFVDRLEDITEGRMALDSDSAQVVRQLPTNVGFSELDVEVRNIEVMLVMLHGTATNFVRRELQQCGYRVTTVSTVFEAFQLIVQTKPEFIIISAIMPELDGIDLTVGLSAMAATRNIPLALITSLDADNDRFSRLPKNVPIIRKGPSFGDDLFEALDNLFLI
ncbi:MAG: hypothetical protein HN491_04755 [Rhodospirillales bacterium]|nr:hypothetical protein [Rhodospirillales bacterium]